MSDKDISSGFVKWINHNHDFKKPFAVHLQYMVPHTPYQPQYPNLLPYFDVKYQNRPVVKPPSREPLTRAPVRLPVRDEENMLANYDDSIRNTDANIQTVIDELKSKGLLENTIIIILSDHGEAFFEHGVYYHHNNLHRELIDIPLIISYKSKIKPENVKKNVSIADLFPTLLSLSGVPSKQIEKYKFDGNALIDSKGNLLKNDKKPVLIRSVTMPLSHANIDFENILHEGIYESLITSENKIIKEYYMGSQPEYFIYPVNDEKEIRKSSLLNEDEIRNKYFPFASFNKFDYNKLNRRYKDFWYFNQKHGGLK